ncbi:CHAT domain-containing protein [Fischerella sp. PCC 9605]|uniref:CHAT domain-containing protein n=1 Tax=Fischerella sp. PCC 9605 TaxID=1173024 RepID=UPI00047BF13D|nr:CHAT domain-containing protein [Fischerella sp. PCC 9605]
MLYRLQRLALATITLSLTFLISCDVQMPATQVETTQNRKKEPLRLQEKGLQQLNQGKFPEALATFEQALSIFKKNRQRQGEGTTLKYIGQTYDSMGKYAKAIESYQQALTIAKEVGNQTEEIETLSRIGLVYYKVGEYSKALEFYQQAFVTSEQVYNKQQEADILHQIASVLEAQQKPELAIVFYKQSINTRSGIPENLQVSPHKQIQQSYINRFADTYRHLADLLLKQNRVVEAQAAVDSLKVQELDSYLRGVRDKAKTPYRMEYLQPEKQVVDKFNSEISQVVKQGKELSELQKIPEKNRTPQQEARRQQIETAQRETLKEFLAFSDSPEVMAHLQKLNRTTGGENLNPKLLRRLQDTLKQLKINAVLLYPLVLEDRLELLLVTPYTPPIRRSVAVKRQELSRAITEFRDALMNPPDDAKAPGQKLYNWLIQPIEPALKEAKAKTIIYAPDGQLRYIPLAALYDGKEWLVQKYRVNNITAVSITDLNKRPQNLKILAGAFTQGNYDVKVGKRTFKLGGLPFAAKEVENVTAAFPGSIKLLNSNFSETETLKQMSNYSILHFATHAAFVPGAPDESFILFGDGNAVNMRHLRFWNLNNADLVVLSACETGLGGKLSDGIEILGFGYVMQEAGAKAAIASLWQVADDGTQALMHNFYTTLQKDKLSKVEALQKAQLALIDDVYDHPYYWAGFILIGNGL